LFVHQCADVHWRRRCVTTWRYVAASVHTDLVIGFLNTHTWTQSTNACTFFITISGEYGSAVIGSSPFDPFPVAVDFLASVVDACRIYDCFLWPPVSESAFAPDPVPMPGTRPVGRLYSFIDIFFSTHLRHGTSELAHQRFTASTQVWCGHAEDGRRRLTTGRL
jgi:hypothetical protein